MPVPASIPAPNLPPPLKPGAYLRLRREAVGLTQVELALLLAAELGKPVRLVNRTRMERAVGELEGDLAADYDGSFLTRIAAYVRLDLNVYLGLFGYLCDPDHGLPVPEHCRTCGCSWHDACVTDDGKGCAWANASATRCTACADPDAAASAQLDAALAAPAPTILSNCAEIRA